MKGRTVFAQLMSLAPLKAFARRVERYRGNARLRRFSCWDQFLSMAFAQLTYRESLRDTEVCLAAMALCYSDFWQSYQNVLPEEQHAPVKKESGQTNHVERWNGTLRQRLGRFVRKTLSFSTCDQMHEICLRLLLHEYSRSRAGDPLYQP